MRMNRCLKLVCQSLLIALGIYFLIISISIIFRPLYLDFFNKNIEIKFVATGDSNESALANNVRIKYITVNGRDLDLSKIKLNGSEEGWKYDSANDFLYVYNADFDYELMVQLKDVHSLTIGTVQEVGSGILEIYINDKLWKSVDLYKDVDWEVKDFDYETSVLVFPEKCLPLQMTILIILWLLCVVWMLKRDFKDRVSAGLLDIALIGGLAIITIFLVSLIQYGDLPTVISAISAQSQSFLKAAVLLFLLIMGIGAASNRIWIGFSVVSIISIAGSIVSKEKLLNREVPLLPWDITMAKEAASVISNYEISISFVDVLSILLIIVLIVLLVLFGKKKRRHISIRFGTVIVIVLILIPFMKTSYIHYEVEANNTDYRVSQVNNYYEERGFVSAFLEYCVYLNASEKPDNYSRASMEQIVKEIKANSVDEGLNTPTIIAVMSESFWDIERVDTLDFKEEVLPNYNNLRRESMYGDLYTHVLNGGTVVSEFEFLTGFSGEFFPQDYMVYGRFIDQGFASAVSILEAQGYQTTALHPYLASNYNRENAYEKFGFDECYFDEDFNVDVSVRNYISDADLFNQVIEKYEENRASERPQFIFTVTMQNHGGYWGETIYKEGLVDYSTKSYGVVTQQSIDDYVAGLHESDRALGKLIDYFRTVDEEVIVIYFGDHVSDAGPKDDRLLEKTSWTKDSSKYDYETHKVPFLVWSNYKSKSSKIDLMEVGELLPTVFEEYGIKANGFWNFLQDVRDVYAASDRKLVINKADDYDEINSMTKEQMTDYTIYSLLQYDYVFGKRYAAELWDNN